MIVRYDDITPSAMADLGCEEAERSCRILQEMAGHHVPDSIFDGLLANVAPALGRCADPDRAVTNLGRWADHVGNRISAYSLLSAYPAAAEILITILAASQYFSDLIIAYPELLEILTNPRIRDRERDTDDILDDMTRRIAIARTPGAQKDALRRQKPAEILRIGARDLLGFADFQTTVREISNFADASVAAAYSICEEALGVRNAAFAVFALGKLGGRELNYSSDIDLVFVHGDGELDFDPRRLAESLYGALADQTGSGFIFRVDLRLRPEGRYGPISRSLSSCRAYYESWAESWERQAFMKSRFVAGDAALGAAFTSMIETFVYPSKVPSEFLDEIRNNKRRLEQKIAHAGEAHRNVKEGYGGIRDVEFAVQLLQLAAGGSNPKLRTANTLEALDRLFETGLLGRQERNWLEESYIFLRTVEHRLQILDEQPIRCLPSAPKERAKLARRMGYAYVEDFDVDYERHTTRTHELFERLFYAERLNPEPDAEAIGDLLLAPEDPGSQQQLREELRRRGFGDVEAALDILRRDVTGSEYGGITPDARAWIAQIAAVLLDGAAATINPDQALSGIESLAVAVPSRAALYRSLAESPEFLSRLCVAAAEGPALWQTLLSHLEYLDLIANPEEEELETRIPVDTLEAVSRVCLRQRLWTGFRDLWGLIPVTQVMREISQAADDALDAAVRIAVRETGYSGSFAVIGMGRYGGAELGYGSDLDVLFVSDRNHVAEAIAVADRVQKLLHDDLGRYGYRFDIDARLRPDGRKGSLALDIDTYAAYYKDAAATWEKQALLKARAAAGDIELGREFELMRNDLLYSAPSSSEVESEIRTMKQRIERERLKSHSDIKLAHGGLADIEWIVQLLQLRHGFVRPRVRRPGTLEALVGLRDDALITQEDWTILDLTYKELGQLRNRLYLSRGVSVDDPDELPEKLAEHMQTVREIVNRLFYGL